ncbi:hypothetical protein LLEC1_00209 [Akanthomyces lecanii]|uniref:DNA recombination and repair protein Rad51-like C-terminal domain-containing protein n=1 Tax=Cordyceps confragosa TaxID=2714763 RepID=A0A179IKM4_CORDF|nr:hypothetical protein LLEC1_00209 [Akanthomyces lecanii]
MHCDDSVTGITKQFSLQPGPVCASTLASEETSLQDRLAKLQLVQYGCAELDGAVLLGGLQRGSVVGVSADNADGFGLLMGLQGTIRAILHGSASRVLVITPKPLASVSKLIMDIAKSELSKSGLPPARIEEKCRTSLDRVMLSVVFDIDGIWPTISELLQPRVAVASSPVTLEEENSSSHIPGRYMPPVEIQDSDDEALSQYVTLDRRKYQNESRVPAHDAQKESSPAICLPEIIVVTHFSTLLTSLFARREKTAAHKSLALLRARLRGLSGSASTNPLILLVNSTTEEDSNKYNESTPGFGNLTSGNKSTEPTLRSIFSSVRSLSPSRPRFGTVFNQFLDLHLLCTEMSNNQAMSSCSVEKAAGSTKADCQGHSPTLVEVLHDNLDSHHVHKRHREQRWAVLDIANQQIVGGCSH